MNRFGIIAGMAVLGLSVMLSGEVRADHDDHDHELRYQPKYRFGAFSHVDDLAVKVMRQSNRVCWEMYRHYRYEPGYRQTYRGAYEMLKTAEYIHELVHHGGRRSRVAHEIEELDKLFHQIERDVQHWQQYGRADYHNVYHARDGLKEMIEMLETDLHHLMDDAGYKPDNSRAPQPEAPVGTPAAPRQGAEYQFNNQNNALPVEYVPQFKNYAQQNPVPRGYNANQGQTLNADSNSQPNLTQPLPEIDQ